MRFFKYIIVVTFSLLCGINAAAQFRDGANYQDLYDSETVAAIKNHVRTLSSSYMEGRKAGSAGEKEAADYVRATLKSYGVDVLSPEDGDIFGIKSAAGDTLTSRNVVLFRDMIQNLGINMFL